MKKLVLPGLLLSFFLILFSPLASARPDGLEKVAAELGFIELGHNINPGLLPDYLFPGIGHEGLATIAAGLVGIAAVFTLLYLLGKCLLMYNRPGKLE